MVDRLRRVRFIYIVTALFAVVAVAAVLARVGGGDDGSAAGPPPPPPKPVRECVTALGRARATACTVADAACETVTRTVTVALTRPPDGVRALRVSVALTGNCTVAFRTTTTG